MTDPAELVRARRQCASCLFRGATEDYKLESAAIPAENWTCHTEDDGCGGWGYSGIQCRGHWEAQHKYGAPSIPRKA